MIAFKRVPNLKLLFWFLDYFRGVDIRKGIPMMFHTNIVKKKNQCPREGMFRGSFVRARGRDEG
jgi:hypothetical protein